MYVKSWNDFARACSDLLERKPDQVRTGIRWKPDQQLLVLKVTDNVVCLKFRTRSTLYLNRFDSLHRTLLRKSANLSARPVRSHVPATTSAAASTDAATTNASSPAGAGAEGVVLKQATESQGKARKGKKKKR